MERNSFSKAFGLKKSDRVCITGGGGKTSLLFRLQQENVEQNIPVLVTTTAHMVLPEDQDNLFLLNEIQADVFSKFYFSLHGKIYLARKTKDGKVSGISDQEFTALSDALSENTMILSESDGAARKPYRIRKETDPSIPECCSVSIHVMGAELGGAILNIDKLHRCPESLFEEIADEEILQKLFIMNHPPIPKDCKKILYINKADAYPQGAKVIASAGEGIFDQIFIGSVREGWIENV